ncbi:F14J16.26 [Arabidopsis thaliana]|uniref:F14J16.26 n=1 Tax=Arabidopsis thaliana TaxID=3702 RepID=Q9LG12_ARATH|nr:F14J16.26 [Arabidopsis thaliana]
MYMLLLGTDVTTTTDRRTYILSTWKRSCKYNTNLVKPMHLKLTPTNVKLPRNVQELKTEHPSR